jgi:hypothetical protein
MQYNFTFLYYLALCVFSLEFAKSSFNQGMAFFFVMKGWQHYEWCRHRTKLILLIAFSCAALLAVTLNSGIFAIGILCYTTENRIEGLQDMPRSPVCGPLNNFVVHF